MDVRTVKNIVLLVVVLGIASVAHGQSDATGVTRQAPPIVSENRSRLFEERESTPRRDSSPLDTQTEASTTQVVQVQRTAQASPQDMQRRIQRLRELAQEMRVATSSDRALLRQALQQEAQELARTQRAYIIETLYERGSVIHTRMQEVEERLTLIHSRINARINESRERGLLEQDYQEALQEIDTTLQILAEQRDAFNGYLQRVSPDVVSETQTENISDIYQQIKQEALSFKKSVNETQSLQRALVVTLKQDVREAQAPQEGAST